MKIRGVDFVLYEVSDLARAAAFYRDRLGLRCTLVSEEWQWAEFDCGNLTLALRGGVSVLPAASSPRLALAVDDLDAAFAELQAGGVRCEGPPEDHGVCRHLALFDPDGNPLILHRRADASWG